MSLAINNGKVYIDGELKPVNILCEGGKITNLSSQPLKGQKTIDVQDHLVLPGLIDPHVHFRDPGLTHKEDFFTGSCASAAGGITTVFDMPNTIPPTTTREALDVKRKAAAKSVVNYGFHFGVGQDNLTEIQHCGLRSAKIYMDVTTGNLKIDDFSIITKVLNAVTTTCFHAESEHIDVILKSLAQSKSGRAYICHVSSADELRRARSDDRLNNRVFVEVTPQHLFLDEQDVETQGSFAQMKPTVKTNNDQKALWQAIDQGLVNTIGTDHAPHTAEEKKQDPSPFGIPGEETMLPLLLNAMHQGKIQLSTIVSLCSENPAEIFGLTSKGKIQQGYDADLTIVDPTLEKKVVGKELFTKCKWSPFEGKLLKGWPVTTIVNGKVVFENGRINDIKAGEIPHE